MLKFLADMVLAVGGSLIHNSIYLIFGILMAVLLKVYVDPEKVKRALIRRSNISILASVAFGALTPLCACGTMAVIIALLTTALPWGPIMAFLTSSPLMSPDGFILLAGIVGVGADHVEMGELIAREVGNGFDRQATLALVREGAVTRMRDALARDLHDTIAQSLAGVSMRLEGLRHWIKDGGDPDSEIQSIKSALRTEQSQVRGMIDRLRRGRSGLYSS